MLLLELFDDFDGGDLMNRLRQSVIDILMPLSAQGVPFTTVQSVVDQLKQLRPGIVVDRGLIMNLLDPDQMKLVSKIEGDRIYFSTPSSDDRKVTDAQKQQDQNHVANAAAKQAQKNVSS